MEADLRRRLSAAADGRQGEAEAGAWLAARGYRLLDRGFRVRGGELDLVAEKEGTIVFVEVKTRKPGARDDGRGAVHAAKRLRLIRAAGLWLARHRQGHRPCRFDVITVALGARGPSFKHLECAFDLADAGA